MDIEVIDDESQSDRLKVIEIDARFPSQTPSVVYHSTGFNMFEWVVEYWCSGRLPSWSDIHARARWVLLSHFCFQNGILKECGEHVLSQTKHLNIHRDTFGAELFISDYADSPGQWAASAFFAGDSEAEIWRKRQSGIEAMQKHFKTSSFGKSEPE
jgi:pyrrolysine biosynthesis protein PylC